MIEKRVQAPTAMHDAKDKRVFVLNAVHNHIFTHGQAAEAGAKIFFARASDIGKTGERKETVRDGVDQAISNVDAAAFRGDV